MPSSTRLLQAHLLALVGAVMAAALSLPGAPASAAVPAASQISSGDQQTVLDLHNQYRAEVGVTPLTWDDQLAADAQRWVDGLIARGGTLAHSNPADPNDPDTGRARGEGENLAGGESAATAPAQWYAEKPDFDAAPNKSGFGDSNPDWVNWGHYTQMVWSGTTKIGCGTAPGPRYQITSCRYSPPGNFDGELPYPGAGTAALPGTSTVPEAGPADGSAPGGSPVEVPAPVDNPAPAEVPAPVEPPPAENPAPAEVPDPVENPAPAENLAPGGNPAPAGDPAGEGENAPGAEGP